MSSQSNGSSRPSTSLVFRTLPGKSILITAPSMPCIKASTIARAISSTKLPGASRRPISKSYGPSSVPTALSLPTVLSNSASFSIRPLLPVRIKQVLISTSSLPTSSFLWSIIEIGLSIALRRCRPMFIVTSKERSMSG